MVLGASKKEYTYTLKDDSHYDIVLDELQSADDSTCDFNDLS